MVREENPLLEFLLVGVLEQAVVFLLGFQIFKELLWFESVGLGEAVLHSSDETLRVACIGVELVATVD